MPAKYEVRLQSPASPQSRLLSVHADTAQDARAIAEANELHTVNFSLLPPERDVWEIGGHAQVNLPDGHATVDLSRWDAHHAAFAADLHGKPYEDHVAGAKYRLRELSRRIDLAPNGKVRDSRVTGRALARYLAHHQTEPYEVTEIREVPQAEIDTQRLVRQVLAAKADPAQWQRTLDALRDAGVPINAVTALLYGLPWQAQIDGSSTQVYSTATVKVALLTAYTVNQDTHHFFSDVSATEVTGTGYTAGGTALGSKTSTYDSASDQIRLDAADTSWTSSTISSTQAVQYVDTAGASTTDMLWGEIDFGGTVATTNGTFSIVYDATGIDVFDVT